MAHKNVIELLAPAGGPEPFNAALAAGADAIYCGLGNNFNARRSAKNFDDASFDDACRRAHLAGTRVYVTVNVAVATDEIPRVLGLVRRAWLLGADAFIIQDWGLFAQIRRTWPQIETHVSTQANVHDARGVAWCRALGADRVTLSRELSLPEIARIAEEGVELECFGHGALCFCYSGVCMMSSLAGGRSANRGLCAQPCRLPYELVDEKGELVPIPDVPTAGMAETMRGVGGTRALCPKDYCTVDHIDEMIGAGVGSLKVEGRMKAPDYVYQVVGAYRQAIDASIAGVPLSPEEDHAVHRQLKRAFNRDFTDAYLLGESDNRMMSYERSNNRGEVVGEVVASRPLEDSFERRGGGNGGRTRMRRFTRAEVTIHLAEPVGAGDLLELRPVSDPTQFLTVNVERDAAAGETVTATAVRPIEAGAVVRVIRSQAAMDAAARVSRADIQRKRRVDVRVVARLGEPFRVELSCVDGEASASAEGFVVEAARTKAVASEDLVEHVGRMGGGPFEPASFDVQMDEGVGMGFSAVHKVRAAAVRALEETLLAPYAEREGNTASAPSDRAVAFRLGEARAAARIADPATVEREEPCACALVADADCARAAFDAGAARVYATADDLSRGEWPEGVIAWLDEVCREGDHDRLDPWVVKGLPVAVGNVSELALAAQRGAAPEIRSCIPVHNESCVVALEEAGAAGLWLSPELTLRQIEEVAKDAPVELGVLLIGAQELMVTEHCMLMSQGPCDENCAECPRRKSPHVLKDRKGYEFPVVTDAMGRSHLYNAVETDIAPAMPDLLAAGISSYMVDATLMNAEETAHAVGRAIRALHVAQNDGNAIAKMPNTTSGHLYRGVS